MTERAVEGAPEERTGVAPVLVAGAVIIGLFFVVFGGWTALAPLKSAAIAPGVVAVESNRKTIKHLEGGIVAEINVGDGDVVTAGQTLLRLDDTQARVMLQRLRGRMVAALALAARLIAERDGKDTIVFPPELLAPEVRKANADTLEGQMNIFQARRGGLAGQKRILEQQSAQLSEEIVGLRGQIRAEDTQLELIRSEMSDVGQLVEKGLAKRSRLLALQRRSAEIEGTRSRNIAAVARARQQIAETRLRVSELGTQQLNQVVEELRNVQTELFDLEERIHSAEDVLLRTNIRAPLDGTIVGLQVHTPGGVIGPGEPLMDLVPSGTGLIIEAQVDPNDIDIVHAGLPAQVRLTAFNQRTFVPVEGKVLTVSADRLTDERSGIPYFLARVVLVENLSKDVAVALYPGMQAEVMIVTGERTVLDYLFRPFMTSLGRAFRED